MSLTDGAEIYICLILSIEFVYDYYWNTRENRKKRRAKRQPEWENLTKGEGK